VAVFFSFSCTGEKNVLRVQGGEVERGSLTQFSGYSVNAQCIGKRSYLEPNSGSMQKPIEGLLAKRLRALNKGGGYSHRAQQTSIFMLETFIYTLNNAKA
jgi:hypothetical protein